MAQNTRLVYSTDPKQNRACAKCKNLVSECTCTPEPGVKSYKFVATLRLEKSGRGGKTVTVIDQLPKSEIFLRDLTKELKSKCGTGGTYRLDGREGVIEIQGDTRAPVRALLEKKGMKTKGD